MSVDLYDIEYISHRQKRLVHFLLTNLDTSFALAAWRSAKYVWREADDKQWDNKDEKFFPSFKREMLTESCNRKSVNANPPK